MRVLGIGLVLVGALVLGAVIDFILKSRKKTPVTPKEPEMAMDTDELHGVVTDISEDEATGLTRITVNDGHGKVLYGFSTIPPDGLKHIYLDKGWMTVPIIRQSTKKD